MIAAAFAWNVSANYFLTDDAFISFRYARHLVEGQGLTWNPGERVEGYTNFFWVLMMAGSMRASLPPELASNALGIVCGVAVLVVVALFAREMSGGRILPVFMTPLALSMSRTFAAWSTGGLETMWFTLLLMCALWATIGEEHRRSRYPIGSALLFGAAALTRPEGVLFAGVTALWRVVGAIVDPRRLQPLLSWCVPITVIVGGHLLWRHNYYGNWLPNTFEAKVPAAWWDHGLAYAQDFMRAYGLPFFFPLVLLGVWRRPDRDRMLVLSSVLAYSVYVIAVGGDRFEFRFWVPVLPWAYWLIFDSICNLGAGPVWTWAFSMAVTAFTIHGSLQSPFAQLSPWNGTRSVAAIDSYATRRIAQGRQLAALIDKGLLPKQLIISVSGAGAVPYYTDWTTVDRLGLNDTYIAHLPVPKRGVIAHEREAPLAYLRDRKVAMDDALNQLLFTATEVDRLPAVVVRAGEVLPLRVVDAGGYYLAFASFVDDEALRRQLASASFVR